MKNILLVLLAPLALTLSIATKASTSDGKVIQYWIHHGGDDNFLFMIENQQGRPSCASFGSPSGRYVVNMNTEKGRTTVAAIMAAKASQAIVFVHGKGTCNLWGDSEDIWHISVR